MGSETSELECQYCKSEAVAKFDGAPVCDACLWRLEKDESRSGASETGEE